MRIHTARASALHTLRRCGAYHAPGGARGEAERGLQGVIPSSKVDQMTAQNAKQQCNNDMQQGEANQQTATSNNK